MISPRRGIAITLYDKFDELGVLHDIFRHHFKDTYRLYVCSNHPNARTEIEKRGLKLDGYIQGENITFVQRTPETQHQWRMSMTCRSLTSLQRSCRMAIDDQCDSVMHLHCDAWPLQEKAIQNLFEQVESGPYWFSMRSNLGYLQPDNPLGTMDDHFFFFNAARMKEIQLFNFDVLDNLPHLLTIHGILAAHVVTKVPRAHLMEYSDWTDTFRWPGGPAVRGPIRPIRPSSYDPERGFIHVHTSDFPNAWGKALQQQYLSDHRLTSGKNIQAYLQPRLTVANLTEELNRWFSAQSAPRALSWPHRIRRWLKGTSASGTAVASESLSSLYRRLHIDDLFRERKEFWFKNG